MKHITQEKFKLNWISHSHHMTNLKFDHWNSRSWSSPNLIKIPANQVWYWALKLVWSYQRNSTVWLALAELTKSRNINNCDPCIWRLAWQKQVARAGTSNYIPQYLWDVITCPCPRYLLLVHMSSYRCTSSQEIWTSFRLWCILLWRGYDWF